MFELLFSVQVIWMKNKQSYRKKKRRKEKQVSSLGYPVVTEQKRFVLIFTAPECS